MRICREQLWASRGSVTVETAITLPLLLLLTLGGISVLWWLHNKTWLQVLVSETAQERAADGLVTGYIKDVETLIARPVERYGLPQTSLVSIHLPVPLADQPPLVIAAACNHPGGQLPNLPEWGQVKQPPGTNQGGWLGPVGEFRESIGRAVDQVIEAEEWLEGQLDEGLLLGQQLVWYRKAATGLASQRTFQRRQMADYLIGGGVELIQPYLCKGEDEGDLVTAKAVIQGERSIGQR